MPSILDEDAFDRLVEWVKTPENIELVVSRLDPLSKDIPLFFQALSLAGKDDILNEYAVGLAPED